MEKIKKKKEKKLEEQSEPEIKIGMSVCVAKFNPQYNYRTAEIGVVIAAFNCDTYLVKFKDGTVDSYAADAIFTDYDKELLK